jgi:hypothetical protein
MMRVDLENGDTPVLKVTVEPWAEEYLLSTGERLTLTFQGDCVRAPLVEHSATGLTVYGWPDSTVAVSRDGAPVSGRETFPRHLFRSESDVRRADSEQRALRVACSGRNAAKAGGLAIPIDGLD